MDISMEDVHSIGLEAMQLITARLKTFGVELEDGQDDEIYVPMINAIEKITKFPDYRSQN